MNPVLVLALCGVCFVLGFALFGLIVTAILHGDIRDLQEDRNELIREAIEKGICPKCTVEDRQND